MNDYVKRILSTLGDRAPLEALRQSWADIAAMSDSIDRERGFDTAYGEGKWTAREIVCHLADAEMAIGFRMRQVIAVENYTVQPFDEGAWARNYKLADPRLALRSFLALREWNLAFLSALPEDAWSKPYRHPEQGDLTFDVLVKLLAGHDINHLSQLRTILDRLA